MPKPYPDKLRAIAVKKALSYKSRRSVAHNGRAADSSVIKWFPRLEGAFTHKY